MSHVLVPVAVLDGESVSPGLMSLLGTVDVTVLGYHVLPEQTPPDQARVQFEDRATAALEDLCREFRTAGGAASHRLVFTGDREQTIRRTADEVGADAFAVSRPTGDVDRVLVSLSGAVNVDQILPFVETLVGSRDISVTLFRTVTDGADDTTAGETGPASDGAAADTVLGEAADRLRAAGIDAVTQRGSKRAAFDALIDAAADHDAVVTGERAPSLRSVAFGDESDRVAAASVGPVVVVRNPQESDEGDADAE